MANYDETDYIIGRPLVIGDTITFNYTGTYKTVTLPPGKFLIQCYGAQGGTYSGGGGNGGYGGYISGYITTIHPQTFYAYVGQQGAISGNTATGGWNGGGSANNQNSTSAGGGGATDIRIISGSWNNIVSLRSRVMVAGGGGGAARYASTPGHGGGLTGTAGSGTQGAAGTQINGGSNNGSFGVGGDGASSNYGKGCGGSGYYGGGSGDGSGYYNPGGGGSSFISGMTGCDAINENGSHTGQSIHYSGIFFTQCSTTSGANTGNGRMKITVIDVFDTTDYNGYSLSLYPSMCKRTTREQIIGFKIFNEIVSRKILIIPSLNLISHIKITEREHKVSDDINILYGIINDVLLILNRTAHLFPYSKKLIFYILRERMSSIYEGILLPPLFKLILDKFYKQGRIYSMFPLIKNKLSYKKGKISLINYFFNKSYFIKIKILTFLKMGNRTSRTYLGKIIPMIWIFCIKVLHGIILAYKGIQDFFKIWRRISAPRSFPLEVEWNRSPSLDNPWGGRVLQGIVVCDKIKQPTDSNIPRAQPLTFAWTKQK